MMAHEFGGLTEIMTALVTPTALPTARQGPHRWHKMTPADFGPEHDFHTEPHGKLVILWPDSKAALHWCYAHLPQDMPRFGARGFLIEREHIKSVVGGARRDGLMTPRDYEDTMNEAHMISLQGEQ